MPAAGGPREPGDRTPPRPPRLARPGRRPLRDRRPGGSTRVAASGLATNRAAMHPTRRVRTMFLVTLLVLTIFAAQLVRLQGLDASAMSAKALKQRSVVRVLPAARGQITDADGRVLADSLERYTLIVDQVAVAEYTKREGRTRVKVGAQGAASDIAPILGLAVGDVLGRLSGKRRWYPVATDVTPVAWRKIRGLGVPGLSTELTSKRFYPAGTSTASVVGAMTKAGAPAGGVEQLMNATLAGKPGEQTYERTPAGLQIPTGIQSLRPAVPGRNVQLTIDADLQFVAQNAISQAVITREATNGYVAVMDVQTAKLLAVGNYPTFDPNDLSTLGKGGTMSNKAFQELFEPGSTAKVMTMAAVLQEGVATPSTPVTVPAELPRADRVFHDSEEHGVQQLTLAGVLATSSNMGTILAGEKIPVDRLMGYFRSFGLGRPTGIGYPGEQPGIVPPAPTGSQRYTVMFGQGMNLDLIQSAGVYQTIANGGVRIPPSLVAGQTGADGRFVPAKAPEPQQVVSPGVAKQLTEMMEAVVSEEGTGKVAAIPGYRVAGKTGTANRYDEQAGTYKGYTASFIGFAPADKPRFVVACTLQNPVRGHYGGQTCGPVFTEVMKAALSRYQVAPSGTESPNLPVTSDGSSLKPEKNQRTRGPRTQTASPVAGATR
ncbi:peptidoglycan D,D-transpeptidase FtsI family protein [Arsenicicoccus dermatophilus]|uniref:peptidoglycan D,D-transpeptidase FtsI family protein n=1 Tax=Arsenicicoccus dermatophilus TaxID=1076331 RepID=UPI001F4CC759|nr:penicillin-binding protein 2 [Arsenicicoccus dermatophilus]MCH8613241.1 penicillin-binding protein 2 [Arsenicicoccus dermatophilus]